MMKQTQPRHRILAILLLLALQYLPAIGDEWVRASGPLPDIKAVGLAGDHLVLWGDSGAVVIDTAGRIIADSIPSLSIRVEAFAWKNDTLWAGGHGGLQYSADKGLSWVSTEIYEYTLPLWTPGNRLVTGLREGDSLVLFDPIDRIRWGHAISVIPRVAVLPGDTLVVLADSATLLYAPNNNERRDGRERIDGMTLFDNVASGWVGVRNDTLFHSTDSFSWEATLALPRSARQISCVDDRVIIWSADSEFSLPSERTVVAMIVDLDHEDPASTLQQVVMDDPQAPCVTPSHIGSRHSTQAFHPFVSLITLGSGQSQYIGPAVPDQVSFQQIVDRDSVQLLVGDRIWRSTNRGRTWVTTLPSLLTGSGPHRECRTSVLHGSLVHVQHLPGHQRAKLWVSTDLGRTWSDHSDSIAALATCSDAVGMYVLTDHTILRSVDLGRTWQSLIPSVPLPPFNDGAVWLDVDGNMLVYSLNEARALVSTDAGQSWREIFRGREWGSVQIIDESLIRSRTESGGTEISTDGGTLWLAGDEVPEPYRSWHQVHMVEGVPTRILMNQTQDTCIIEQFDTSGDEWRILDTVAIVPFSSPLQLQLTEHRRLFQTTMLMYELPAPTHSVYYRTIDAPLVTNIEPPLRSSAACIHVRSTTDGWWVEVPVRLRTERVLTVFDIRGRVVDNVYLGENGVCFVPASGAPMRPLWAVVGGCAARLR